MRSYGTRIASVLVVSACTHLAFFVFLGLVPPPSVVMAAKPLEFEVLEPPPLPELPPEEIEPEPEPEPEPPKPQPRAEKAPTPTEDEPPPPPTEEPPAPAAEETPFDFTGVTLTGDGNAGWSTAVGNGQAMRGPVGKPGARVTGRAATGAPEAESGPQVVAEADLSRRPSVPGDMNASLKRHYPPQAEQQGVEGFAIASIRILPNGRVSRIRIKRESFTGFGDACRQALEETPWAPPLDKGGQPVAFDIPTFTCRFEVEQ